MIPGPSLDRTGDQTLQRRVLRLSRLADRAARRLCQSVRVAAVKEIAAVSMSSMLPLPSPGDPGEGDARGIATGARARSPDSVENSRDGLSVENRRRGRYARSRTKTGVIRSVFV